MTLLGSGRAQGVHFAVVGVLSRFQADEMVLYMVGKKDSLIGVLC